MFVGSCFARGPGIRPKQQVGVLGFLGFGTNLAGAAALKSSLPQSQSKPSFNCSNLNILQHFYSLCFKQHFHQDLIFCNIA
jgi:hypothetical protein